MCLVLGDNIFYGHGLTDILRDAAWAIDKAALSNCSNNDWLYVEDHCSGIWEVVTRGRAGEPYNIGGDNEWTNIDFVRLLCRTVATVLGRPGGPGWKQSLDLARGLERTVGWYLENKAWVQSVRPRVNMRRPQSSTVWVNGGLV